MTTGYRPSAAAQADAEAARQAADASRAAESLVAWADRYGHRVDPGAVHQVLAAAAELRAGATATS